MPCGDHSPLKTAVSASTPAFAAQYAARPAPPRRPTSTKSAQSRRGLAVEETGGVDQSVEPTVPLEGTIHVCLGDPVSSDVAVNCDYVRTRCSQVGRGTFGRLAIPSSDDEGCAGIGEKSSADPPDSSAGAGHENHATREGAACIRTCRSRA